MSATLSLALRNRNKLKNIPMGWSSVTLDQLAQIIDPQPDHRAPRIEADGYSYVGIGDIEPTGFIDHANCRKVSEEAVIKQEKAFRIDYQDIGFGKVGTVGKVVYFTENNRYAISATMVVIKPFPSIDRHFLYHLLESDQAKENIAFRRTGTTRESLGIQQIREFEFTVPPLNEQKKIAAILSSIDRAIEQTENLIAKQQRIKRGLLQDLLARGIDEHGAIRSEATHEFKDSPLGRIPKEWDVKKLDEIKESITSGSRGWAKYYSSEGDIFLRIGNLTRENINLRLEHIIRVNPPQGNEGIRTALQKDDVLISITADLGMVGIIPEGFGKAYVNQHIALVRLDQEKAFSRWVAYYLAGRAGKQQFEKLNESGAKAGLNLPTVASLLVAVPKRIEEQVIVSHLLDKHISMIEEEEINRHKLESIKIGLMQDLLTGEVRVSREQTN